MPSRCASDDAVFAPRHRAACPSVDEDAWPRLEAAARALYDWNAKINVVSRKGLDPLTLIERHYPPSLALLAAPPLAHLPAKARASSTSARAAASRACRWRSAGPTSGSTSSIRAKKRRCSWRAPRPPIARTSRRRRARPGGFEGPALRPRAGPLRKGLPDFFETIAPLLSTEGSVLYIKGGDLEEAGAPLWIRGPSPITGRRRRHGQGRAALRRRGRGRDRGGGDDPTLCFLCNLTNRFEPEAPTTPRRDSQQRKHSISAGVARRR